MAILQYHLPFCGLDMLQMTVEFLQKSHELKLDFSVRDGINLLRYAIKRMAQDPEHPLASDQAWLEALKHCLGDEALDLDRLAKQKSAELGGQHLPMGFGDFFFSPEDPLHPDIDEMDEDDDQ